LHILLENLVRRYPELEQCLTDIQRGTRLLEQAFRHGGKLLICGNGGSASDSEHIATELMKSFRLPRPLSNTLRDALTETFPAEGAYLAEHLQEALPAIPLVSNGPLLTATGNDVDADMIFAQQVCGYGKVGDVLMGISTSGTSRNVRYALQVARVLGLHTLGLTGMSGGVLPELCDVTIRVPADTTTEIQELHIPVYHVICSLLEETFYAEYTDHPYTPHSKKLISSRDGTNRTQATSLL
jgi:phosphoheptose isomerase